MAAEAVRKQAGIQSDDWLTLNQAADKLGIHRQTLLKRAVAGEFEATTLAGKTFISRASVERAIESARA